MHIYTEECRESEDFSKVERIGVDETAAHWRHDYESLFVDLDKKKTIFVTEGKGSGTVDEFAKDLVAHNGKQEQITEVSCDMSPAYIKGVTDHLPESQIVFDRFHLMKVVNEAVDKVRKEEAKTNPILKSSRYIFLKNRENHTAKHKQTFESLSISGLNLKTMRAYRMKEAFQQIYNAVNPSQFLYNL